MGKYRRLCVGFMGLVMIMGCADFALAGRVPDIYRTESLGTASSAGKVKAPLRGGALVREISTLENTDCRAMRAFVQAIHPRASTGFFENAKEGFRMLGCLSQRYMNAAKLNQKVGSASEGAGKRRVSITPWEELVRHLSSSI